METRLGNQEPTYSHVIPYTKTLGDQAIELYNKSSKRKVQEWQESLTYDIMAVNEDGLWTHTKFGWSVPRRNGKNEICAIRELWGLINGENILHTAHRTTTSHTAWDRLVKLLEECGYKEKEDYTSYKALGLETITMLKSGGKISFRTRSSKAGLGEGFDLLVIDEAQEYTSDQESALKYTVTSSKNPQTLFCGTPPTTVSSGTVFPNMRKNIMYSDTENQGWAEWGVEHLSDVRDKELWYLTNPSLGYVFTERSVQDEVSSDEDDKLDFNIQRLGLWFRYNQKSVISKKLWSDCFEEKQVRPKGKLFVGVKFNVDGMSVSVGIAVKTYDDYIFIEHYGTRQKSEGYGWIVDLVRTADIEKVIIDGANGQQVLDDYLKEHKIKNTYLPSVREVIQAYSCFENALYQSQLKHKNQSYLSKVATNTDKRLIGTNGGFGYRSLVEELDVSSLDSVVLAFWSCYYAKDKKPQKISY